jgi:hypothetical protein
MAAYWGLDRSAYAHRLLTEAVGVGVALGSTWYMLQHVSWGLALDPRSRDLALVAVAGAATHLLLEALDVNAWYLIHSAATLRALQAPRKCEVQAETQPSSCCISQPRAL